MPDTHKVLRSIGSGADRIIAGSIVDATEWAHTELLVEQGYLEPLQTDESKILSLDDDEDKEKETARKHPWQHQTDLAAV